MDWAAIKSWYLGLGEAYGVDPVVFGAIYVGAIPFFTASIAWLVQSARSGRSVILPTLSAGFFFVSAYLYLIVAGKNVPIWVCLVVVALIGFGAVSTIKKVRARIQDTGESP